MLDGFINDFLHPDEIIVDNFAGGGGASTGIEMALGRSPDVAINHDAQAVAMHKANHPDCEHYCQNIWQADPVEVASGRPIGLAWFSPDCTHFSKAKGGKPKKKNIRDLAWVVPLWAQKVKPRLIFMENVEEWLGWGPLDEHGHPAKRICQETGKQLSTAGETFRVWLKALKKEGYKVEWKILKASDYGAPTIRKRLFLIARCDGLPIRWPDISHGDPKSDAVAARKLLPWVAAADIIDWSLPCPSIFMTADEAKEYRKLTGIKCIRPLADNTMARIARGLKRYVLDASEPFIVKINHKGDRFRGQDIKEPLHTLTGKNGAAVVTPYTVSYYGTKGGSDLRTPDIQEPLRTQTTENRFGVVAPITIQCANSKWDKGGRSLEGPLQTITAVPKGGSISLVSAFIVKHFGGVTGVEATTPFPTITQRGTQNQIVAAHLTKFKGQSVGSDCKEPARTITSKESDGLVAASMIKMRGKNTGSPADEPLHTISAGGQHHAALSAFMVKYYGNEKEGVDITQPCHTVTAKDRLGLVMVEGEMHQIIDIGMRMLTPRELYRAQGFPEDYIIDPEFKGKPLIKSEQVAKCGNSVSPIQACEVISANLAGAEVREAAQ